MKKWNSKKYTYTQTDLCPRCNQEEETIEHLIKCEKNRKITSKLYKHTIELIKHRLNNNIYYTALKEQHFKPLSKHLILYIY